MSTTFINAGETSTTPVVLDDFGDSLEVFGSLTTGAQTPAVLTQNLLNQIEVGSTGEVNSLGTALEVQGQGTIIEIDGEVNGGVNAINIANQAGASARITNRGLITSQSRAINIGGDGGVVINEGEIVTTQNPRNGVIYGDETARNIVIENRASGIIHSAPGTNGDAISLELGRRADGSITNDGLIQGRGLPGIANPNNQAAAIRFYTPNAVGRFIGNVNNTGTLAAENGPAVVVEENAVLRGQINNSGSILSVNSSTGVGLRFEDGSRFTGSIINTGTINGGSTGIDFANGGTARGRLINEQGGIVTSASRAVNIGGDRNTIINRGLITTSADPRNGTVYADQSANNFRIVNDATGVIDVGEGLNGDAVALQLGSNVNGAIINRGLIQGRGNADGNQNNATNQATAIRLYHGSAAGPVSVFNGNIQNLETGTLISENDHAILIEQQVQLNGNIVNTGLIFSNGEDAIRTEGEVNGNIVNRGTISADSDGLQISSNLNGNIVNSGNITSTDNGEGIDLRALSLNNPVTLTGNIINSGTIFGGGGGIRVGNDVTVEGNINNRGTILGLDSDGIQILGSITGTINNSGVIQTTNENDLSIAGSGADGALRINNSGVIAGDVELSNFNDVFNGSRGITQGEIFGRGGDDTLIGGRLRDRLVGGEGDDFLTGGGSQDTFVVTSSGNGNDTLTDFQNGIDRIDISARGLSLTGLDNLILGSQQQGNDVLITLALVPNQAGGVIPGESLLLQNFQLGQLDRSDFIR